MSTVISQLYSTADGGYVISPVPSGGARVTENALEALSKAVSLKKALRGEPFKVSPDVTNKGGQFETLELAGSQSEVLPWSVSSAASGELLRMSPPVVEPEYSSLTVPAQPAGGEISDDVLKMIRAFVPKDEDKAFAFIDFAPAASAILVHRQRAMALMRRGFTPAAIKQAVDNKTKKFLADVECRNAVMGIPKKKLELILSDSVLIHRNTNYSSLLRELFYNRCVVSDAMISLVPDYIGVGGKMEKVAPDAAETLRRRKRFLTNTAQYLEPLYNSEGFRAMIATQKSAVDRASGPE